jgi:GNAT superfamily N-acetyltransferase
MSVTYFKRFKMEIDLYAAPALPALPDVYRWVPWDESLLEIHAVVKFGSFHDEIDASVFPSLGDAEGCRTLMREIRRKTGFLPGATWLINCAGVYCGTVQGIREHSGVGAIQNLGVLPAYRGRGLGSALLLKALEGFRSYGLGRALLEVTAQNSAAVQLYRRLGFRCRKTLYKAADLTALDCAFTASCL